MAAVVEEVAMMMVVAVVVVVAHLARIDDGKWQSYVGGAEADPGLDVDPAQCRFWTSPWRITLGLGAAN